MDYNDSPPFPFSMAVRPGSAERVLPYKSAAFEAHKDIIKELDERAKRLGFLRTDVADQIFTRDGIVCDRPREDRHANVASSYFGLTLNTLRRESPDNDAAANVRIADEQRLLRDVLAAHLSIAECPETQERDPDELPYEAYREILGEIDLHCRQHEIPSLMPNLFLPSSLFRQMKDVPYVDHVDEPATAELFDKLAILFCRHDK